MKRLFITQSVFDDTLEVFSGSSLAVDVRERDTPLEARELAVRLRDYHGVVCMLTDHINEEVLNQNPQLEVVANVAVGFDNIDLRVADRLGIVVTNTPDVLTQTTADLAMALILSVARRIVEADGFVRSGSWERWKLQPEQVGTDVYGKTLGLVGMGRIGRAVADRAVHGFGMKVLYTSRTQVPDAEGDLGAHRVELYELLERSDVLSLHAPLTEQTRHLIGARELAAMKTSAILINTARGPLVDEEALADALESKKLWGAGLDVFTDEPRVNSRLFEIAERVVLTPHIGSATMQARRLMARTAATNARQVLDGYPPLNPVSVSVH